STTSQRRSWRGPNASSSTASSGMPAADLTGSMWIAARVAGAGGAWPSGAAETMGGKIACGHGVRSTRPCPSPAAVGVVRGKAARCTVPPGRSGSAELQALGVRVDVGGVTAEQRDEREAAGLGEADGEAGGSGDGGEEADAR